MKLHLLESLLTIVQYKSISKAAEALYISQPALSKQLRQLEEQLGFPLFVRTSAGVQLTAKGEAFYQDAAPLIKQLEHTWENHQQQIGIRIGSDPILASYYFPDCMDYAPHLNMQITDIKDDSVDLLPLLKNQDIDAAVIQDYPEETSLHSSFLFEDVFYAAVSINHTLADKQEVFIQDCLAYKQLLPPKGTPLYQRITQLLSTYDFSPPVREMPYHSLVGSVARNNGITYLPEIMVHKMAYRGVIFLPITNSPLIRSMYLYTTSKPLLDQLLAQLPVHREQLM
ncbi:LysR family transcriptional regulator [Salsuginibacillus kocurii]|uniref:LysR family transcriptional regulator n=1 Tax=Salsuginibacillus kocurii TaxID=427078 RepID=UPI00035C78EA|nr:LysR family transcriptional regulator [Salsuginibacillus kocurii]